MTDMDKRDLLDSDGENRAVRAFLQLYDGGKSVTMQRMRRHLDASGFDEHWPGWAVEDGHLTAGGAQAWIRHLFTLEAAQPAALTAEQIDRCRKLTLDYAIAAFEMNGGRMVNTAWVVQNLEELKDVPMDVSVITGGHITLPPVQPPAQSEQKAEQPEATLAGMTNADFDEVHGIVQEQQPVMYQRRARPTWKAGPVWYPWEECSAEAYEDCIKTPIVHSWEYEARKLYASTAQAEQTAPEWISVKDRLPETFVTDDSECRLQGKRINAAINSDRVLVALLGGSVRVDRLAGLEGHAPYWDTFRDRVAYWKPLPAAPQPPQENTNV